MGITTDAILFYGFLIPKEHEENIDFIEDDKCEVDMHCTPDDSMYFVCVKESKIAARRGYPREISLDTWVIKDVWEDQLRSFCDNYDIEFRTPNWHLVSFYSC